MKEFLHHLLFPRHSNNHRSKLLHHQSILLFIAFFIASGFFVRSVKTTFPQVLGEAINITVEQLLSLTNQKRQEQGLPSLRINPTLSQAAALKAKDMLEKNYWAHNNPDGTTPWFFFKQSGYEYVYAGENLARGFNEAEIVVKAWMASPTHRENMLSSNYDEIGFAVERGVLTGEETTLVVEMFGSRNKPAVAKIAVASEVLEPKATSSSVAVVTAENTAPITRTLVAPLSTHPAINSRSLSGNLSSLFILFFLLILALDMIIVERKKIVRLVGHNLDHAMFLGGIALIILFTRGLIL